MSSTVAVVEQALNTLKRSMTYIDSGMQTTLDITQDLLDIETDIPQSTFDELKDIMKEYVELQEDSRQFADAAEKVKDQFSLTNSIDMEADLDKLLVNLEKPTIDNIEKNPKYQALTKKIWAYQNPDKCMETGTESDDDLIMTTTPIIVTIDPISKQEMKDPVKNIICKHSYDRSTITQYITNKKKARCPFVGCGNNNLLKLCDLEDDKEMKSFIERKNRQASRK